MRALALATLFLGVSLIDPGPNVDARAALALVRGVVFFVTLAVILLGA